MSCIYDIFHHISIRLFATCSVHMIQSGNSQPILRWILTIYCGHFYTLLHVLMQLESWIIKHNAVDTMNFGKTCCLSLNSSRSNSFYLIMIRTTSDCYTRPPSILNILLSKRLIYSKMVIVSIFNHIPYFTVITCSVRLESFGNRIFKFIYG